MMNEEITRLTAELGDLREAAFAVELFALPYWEDCDDPKMIPVGNAEMRELQRALYPEATIDAAKEPVLYGDREEWEAK